MCHFNSEEQIWAFIAELPSMIEIIAPPGNFQFFSLKVSCVYIAL